METKRPRVIGDKVLLKMEPKKTVRESGLEIVEGLTSTESAPMIGTVIMAGDGYYLDGKKVPLTVKAGDKVIIPKWSGDTVMINEREYVIVKERDILAILDE